MLAPARWEVAAGPEGDGADGRRRTLRGAGGERPLVTPARARGARGPRGAARARHEVPARQGRERDGSPAAPGPGGIGLLAPASACLPSDGSARSGLEGCRPRHKELGWEIYLLDGPGCSVVGCCCSICVEGKGFGDGSSGCDFFTKGSADPSSPVPQ